MGWIRFVCCVIGISIIGCLRPGISADTMILAFAILMCGYIASKD